MLETKYGMKYPFPHTLVHIVDNSAYTGDLPVVVADNPSMYGTLVVAGFPMGEDNRVIGITRSDILNVAYGLSGIGASEIQKFGQTITYPVSLIDQGAPIQLMRVTPSDATYAYSCVTIEWRWEADNPNGPKMHVRYNTARLGNDRDLMNYKNRDRLSAAIMASVKDDEYNDGTYTWKRRAFMVNISAGRGEAYNHFATAINQTIQQKRPANARYLFTTINMDTNTTVEQYHASLINDSNQRTDAIDNVNVMMGKRADGSSVVVQYLNEDAIRELYNDYRTEYAEMLNTLNAANGTVDQSYINAYNYMNINTFDPIFGLYLFNGTDDANKLPFFQVDMRSADVPLLPEALRVYYPKSTNPSNVSQYETKLLGDRLLNTEYGIIGTPSDTNDPFIGDLYLYGGVTTLNNPFIYIVASINQYTGAITTVRVNQLRFKGEAGISSYIDVQSQLKTIIEVQSEEAMKGVRSTLKKKIQNGYVLDGDTFAVYFTSTKTWKLYYVADGVTNHVKDGDYDTWIETGDNASKYLPEYTIDGYNFIAWDAANASNLIGINESDPAYVRIGASCIRPDLGFDIDPDIPNGSVYVNATNVASNPSEKVIEGDNSQVYFVSNRTASAVMKYGAPPASISSAAKSDVVGTQYDVIECDLASANYVKFNTESTALPLVFVPTYSKSGITGFDTTKKIGWKPYTAGTNNGVCLFDLAEESTSSNYTLTCTDTIDIMKSYIDLYDGITESRALYVAANVIKAYSYLDDDVRQFIQTPFTSVKRQVPVPTFAPDKYFKKEGNEFVLLADAPDDWTERYTSYFENDIAGKGITGNINNIYNDVASGKWYLFKSASEADPTYVEEADIKAEDQIMRRYTKTTTDTWVVDTSVPEASATYQVGGFKIFTMVTGTLAEALLPSDDITSTATVIKVMDARCASKITRYAVVGTVGSLYRTQATSLVIANDYYSDDYGINLTSTDGGIKLEDGSTGFFDDNTMSSIEYKWNYSKLLVEAFRGKIDPRIMSPTRTPAKYLFDGAWNTVVGQLSLPTMNYSAADIIAASTIFTEDEKDDVLYNPSITAGWDGNVSVDVKQAMYDLMDYRVYQGIPEDKRPLGPGSGLSLHLDGGVTDEATAQSINKSFTKRFDNPNASWDIGGIISSADGLPYTFVKKIVDNLVNHCKTYTVNKPFTGIYTKIGRDEYVSYFPDIDTTDWDYRELMYNSGGNSWIPDVNGTLMRRSQRTLMRGSDTSDLIQESNMRTLSQLVYLLQNKLEEKLFEYNDDSVLRTMQDEINNMFTNWAGNMVESLNIQFVRDINPNDGGEVVVCYVDVVFRGINLRIPIIVNVNRRVTSTT